jgi:hypothetical protein
MPSGNVEPGAGVQSKKGVGSRLSVALNQTAAPAGDVASAVVSPGKKGGVRSIVQSKVLGVLWFPAASTARTWNECRPSTRPEYVVGDMHSNHPEAFASRRQIKVVPLPEEILNVALVSRVHRSGLSSIVGFATAADDSEANGPATASAASVERRRPRART